MNNKTIKFFIIGIILVGGLFLSCMIIDVDNGNNSNFRKELNDDPTAILQNAQNESNIVKKDEMKDFIYISVDEYYKYFSEEQKRIILIGRTGCHYCEMAEPILKNIAFEYDLDIYYLSLDNMDSDTMEQLKNSNEGLSDGLGTPKLLLISNGTIYAKKNGMTDTQHYLKFFKDNKVIK